jgi:hypothetical protein
MKWTLILIMLLFCSCMLNAQQLVLKKNGTLNRYYIDSPNKLKVKYLTDSSIDNFQAKVIAYEFPNMTVSFKVLLLIKETTRHHPNKCVNKIKD